MADTHKIKWNLTYNVNLQDLSTNTGRISNRIRQVNEQLTAMEEHRIKEIEAAREKEARRIVKSLEVLDQKILDARNAARGARIRHQLAEAKQYEEEEKMLETIRIFKLIELGKLEGEDTADLEIELKNREDSKTKALIKAEQEELANLLKKERERERIEGTAEIKPKPEEEQGPPQTIPIAPAIAQSPKPQEAQPIESSDEAKALLDRYKEKFKEMIRSIPVKKKFGAGSDNDLVAANRVNKVINTLADRADRFYRVSRPP